MTTNTEIDALRSLQKEKYNQDQINVSSKRNGRLWSICWTYALDFDRDQMDINYYVSHNFHRQFEAQGFKRKTHEISSQKPQNSSSKKKFMQVSDLERPDPEIRVIRLKGEPGNEDASNEVGAKTIRVNLSYSIFDHLKANRHQIGRMFAQSWLQIGKWEKDHVLVSAEKKGPIEYRVNDEASGFGKIFAIFRMVILFPVTFVALAIKIRDYFSNKETWHAADEYLTQLEQKLGEKKLYGGVGSVGGDGVPLSNNY